MFRTYAIINHRLVIRNIPVHSLYPYVGIPHDLIKQLIAENPKEIDALDQCIRDALNLPVGRYAIVDIGSEVQNNDGTYKYTQTPLFYPKPLNNFLLQGTTLMNRRTL